MMECGASRDVELGHGFFEHTRPVIELAILAHHSVAKHLGGVALRGVVFGKTFDLYLARSDHPFAYLCRGFGHRGA